MPDATSMFSSTLDSINSNDCENFNTLLNRMGALRCRNAKESNYSDLPVFATREKHHFKWGDRHRGSVDLIQRRENLLQCAVNLQYANKRWFSPHTREWNRLTEEAETRLGPGKCFDLAGKTTYHFQNKDVKVLISSYRVRKSAYIEIKVARDEFCY